MIRITKIVEHVPSFLLQLNYSPETTFILSDIPLDLEGTFNIEKNSIYIIGRNSLQKLQNGHV